MTSMTVRTGRTGRTVRTVRTVRRLRTPRNDLVDGLLAASRALLGMTARSMAQVDADVTLPQYRVLVVLASRGRQRTAELAKELDVASSTVTRMCDRLDRKALIRRYRRGDDRRATWVALTESGRDLVGTVMRQRREHIAKALRSVTIADPSAAAEVLRAIVEAAGELPERDWWQRWQTSAEADETAVGG